MELEWGKAEEEQLLDNKLATYIKQIQELALKNPYGFTIEVESHIQTILASRLRLLYTNIVVDSTWGDGILIIARDSYQLRKIESEM